MQIYEFLNLHDVNSLYFDKLKKAAERVITSGRYIGGEEVEAFEQKLANMTGATHAIGCGNGLDALRLIMMGYMELGRLKPGDEVIVPTNSFIASALAVSQCGLKPVFADVDEQTMNLDLKKLPISGRTRAIMPVHLYGRVCHLPQELKEEFLIIEDAAQAIGADMGYGHAAAFSFYPTKNVGALGDAGAVTTDDSALAEVISALRNYGCEKTYVNIYQGINSRIDPIQAAMINVKLDFLDLENNMRRLKAETYSMCIEHPLIEVPFVPKNHRDHVWHQYVIRVKEGKRDELREYLQIFGIETAIHYPTPIHLQPCYADHMNLNLPVAERLADEILSLPISRAAIVQDAADISERINKFPC